MNEIYSSLYLHIMYIMFFKHILGDVSYVPSSMDLFWWPWGNILFFASVFGSLLRGRNFASVLFLNLRPRTSEFYLAIRSSEGMRWLARGAAVSGFLWFVGGTFWLTILNAVVFELLQRLKRWCGRRGGRGRLCRWWVLGQSLAYLCIAELSRPLLLE